MSETKRLVITTPQWGLSGVNRFAERIGQALQANGWEVTVLTTVTPVNSGSDEIELPEGIAFEHLGTETATPVAEKCARLKVWLEDKAPCVYLPNYDFDVAAVSSQLPASVAILGILHSDEAIYYQTAAFNAAAWNAVVGVSTHIVDVARRRCPQLAADRLHHIPYGVPFEAKISDKERFASRPLRLLYAGRIDQRQKRVFDLPLVAAELDQRGVHYVLSIVGNGPELASLKERCAAPMREGRIVLLDAMDFASLQACYRQQQLFLLVSNFEGLPIGLLEAMGNGMVPIVSRIRSGVGDVVKHGENGFLCDIGDAAAFANVMANLEPNPTQLAAISERATQTIAEGYTLKHMTDAYRELCERLHVEAVEGSFHRTYRAFQLPPHQRPLFRLQQKLQARWYAFIKKYFRRF